MKPESIKQAVAIGKKLGHILVATADTEGLPHVAAAAAINHVLENRVEVAAWFCPGTLANLQHNRRISLVIWDADTDTGYQMLGQVENIGEQAVMNGYMPESEEAAPLPQIERVLRVKVKKVIAFSHAPHSDVEE
jgi:hypothetical protein